MSQALYRRYRPETFDDVIGQEHVTAPLMQALSNGRVNHAYLFSGPRGCGKTTSARILARILNCARWEPDAAGRRPSGPCGTCDSCQELSRGGSGSLDVVEIDAASHGGVDDARELRERATFAPARDRYKVFVIDEAHMVTTAGFNALLKIVEEPPEHVRFIFATTEPDKVLPTIRSRTHHYPFHLVPSEQLLDYLENLCREERVPVGKGVLPLVVRAGAGSVRDSLSVLDQLMAGAGADGVDYERAVSLLGYTHAALLDDVVDALAAGDGASVFRVVDRVIESGHDPRRFVEDLLERMRDLIIVRAVGENAHVVLRGVPEDQLARMAGQAGRFGAAELSRCADVANAALTEMTGATSPRLHLELLCARMLLPGADVAERGLTARLDRLERRIGVPAASAAPAAAPAAVPAAPAAVVPTAQPSPQPGPQPSPQPVQEPDQGPVAGPAPEPASRADAPVAPSAPGPVSSAGDVGAELDAVRRMWPDILARLASIKRGTWTLVSQNAQVADYSGGVVRLAFGTDGLARAFTSGAHAELTRQALIDVLGLDAKVEPVVGAVVEATAPVSASGSTTSWEPAAPAPAPREPSPEPSPGPPAQQLDGPAQPPDGPALPPGGADQPAEPPAHPPVGLAHPPVGPALPPGGPAAASEPTPAQEQRPQHQRPAQPQPAPPTAATRAETAGRGAEAARAAARRPAGATALDQRRDPRDGGLVAPENDVPAFDDADAEDSGLIGTQVVEQLLGGRVIQVDE